MSTEPVPVSKKALWAGYILSALPVLLLLMSGVMKLARLAPVMQGFAKYGFPETLVAPLGVVEIACTVVYLIPRTSVVGAILLTGYMGGAVCTLVRVSDPTWFMPGLCGVFIWGGLFLRDPRIRALIPLKR
jgi:hypothetical protein